MADKDDLVIDASGRIYQRDIPWQSYPRQTAFGYGSKDGILLGVRVAQPDAPAAASPTYFSRQVDSLIKATARLPKDIHRVFARGIENAGKAGQLAKYRPEGVEEQLAGASRHAHPCVRYAVLTALADADSHPAVGQAFALALNDPDPAISRIARLTLEQRRKTGRVTAVELAPALPGASVSTRHEIIHLVGQRNAEDMVPLLAEMMDRDPEPGVRSQAATTIRWSRLADAADPLVRRVRLDSDPEVRSAALDSLEDLRDWRGFEPAREALFDPDPRVRNEAVEVLRELELYAYSRYREALSPERSTSDYRNEQTKDMVPPPVGAVARLLIPLLNDPVADVRKKVIGVFAYSLRPKSFTSWGLTDQEKSGLVAKFRMMATQDPDREVRIEAESSIPGGLPKEIECQYCRYQFSPYEHADCPHCRRPQPDEECEIKLVRSIPGHISWVAVRTNEPSRGEVFADRALHPESELDRAPQWIARTGRELADDLAANGWVVTYRDAEWESTFVEPWRVHYRMRRQRTRKV